MPASAVTGCWRRSAGAPRRRDGDAEHPLRALPRDESQVEVVEVVTPPAPKAAAPAARPRTQPRRHAARARVAPIVRLPQVRQRVHEEVVDLLGMDGVLDLDDSPAAATGVSRPWSRGLRG